MGSCISLLCHQEVRRIWRWAIERDIFITAARITGILNEDADQEIRKSALTIRSYMNYMNLSLVIFKNIEIFVS